jgi:uncharacterized membrane protein YdjX (TVP38/TMEM64 family)
VFALVSTLGRAPGTWILSAQGGYIAAGHLWKFAALVILLAVLLPVYYYRHTLLGFFRRETP